MTSLSSNNQGVKYLLCVIDVFTKYAWIKPLKYKKAKTVLNSFIGKVNESKHKPNKVWVDQGRESYNNLMQKWLDDNDILMYSNQSYLGYFSELVYEYNNAYYRSIGKETIHVDYSAFSEEFKPSHKARKFKVDGRVRVTKYKNILSKGYTDNWSREIFVINSVMKTNT